MAESFLDRLDLLVERGVYENRAEMISEALRALLRSRPKLKEDLAVELYKRGEVSLAHGAEISGLNFEDFKKLLEGEGVEISIPPAEEKLEGEVEEILRICR